VAPPLYIGNNPIKNPPICVEKTEKEREGARERLREERESTAGINNCSHSFFACPFCYNCHYI
jgi:hypothetical protein